MVLFSEKRLCSTPNTMEDMLVSSSVLRYFCKVVRGKVSSPPPRSIRPSSSGGAESTVGLERGNRQILREMREERLSGDCVDRSVLLG
jgi:hypothetical protein